MTDERGRAEEARVLRGTSVAAHSASAVGTLPWAEAGGPPLTACQMLGQLAGATLTLLEALPHELRHAAGTLGLLPPLALPEQPLPELPDTPAVKRSLELLHELSSGGEAHSAVMAEHSLRCYYLAATMARLDRVSLDEEVLAVAMLLHDVGLFAAVVRDRSENEFTVRGAAVASRMLADLGWSRARLDRVAQAIVINANARVPLRTYGPEAHYGRLAPVCDGLGEVWRIPVGTARQIFSRHPKGDLARAVSRLVAEEAERQPGGRFALLRHFFPSLVRLGSRRWDQVMAVAPRG